ncbi:MAG: Rrf2 family transcriptional regulator [Thermomicrobiales bacterium]
MLDKKDIAMKVSTRGEYGVRAMVTLAKRYGTGPASISTIARESSIPYAYLEQLIAPLKQAGLVESRRGAAGGYVLKKAPNETRVGEIYRAMEGPIAPMECVSEDIVVQTCPLIPNCETRPVWMRVRDSIAETLDSMTLADLIGESAPAPAAKAPLTTAGLR